MFHIGKIRKLTKELEDAYTTLNEVHVLMRTDGMTLCRNYPMYFAETNLLLADICITNSNPEEACRYLKQGIPMTELVQELYQEGFDATFLNVGMFKALQKCIGCYAPNTKRRKHEHIIFNNFLGQCHLRSRDYQIAFGNFSRALELLPEVDSSIINVEELKLHQGQSKIKLEDYNEALDIFKSIPTSGLTDRQTPWTHLISAAFCQHKLGLKCTILTKLFQNLVENGGQESVLSNVWKCTKKAYNREESDFFQEQILQKEYQRLLPKKIQKIYPQYHNSLSISRDLKYLVDKKHDKMAKNLKDCPCYQYSLH
jgi:tetratricopeptide (TPR) repeat protein